MDFSVQVSDGPGVRRSGIAFRVKLSGQRLVLPARRVAVDTL